MKKQLLYTALLFFSCFALHAQGFQFLFWPNLNQYDHTGFYVDGPKMIMGGSYYAPSTRTVGVLMTADTSATLSNSWTLDESVNGWGLKNIRKIDANNTLLSGSSSIFPNSALIAKFNHTTGAVAFCKYYSANAGFGDAFASNDAITLSNGDFAVIGNMNENLASTPCPSGMGACQAASTNGYFKGNFGTNSYGRGDDICLIRTDGNGDSLWVKKYSLAYDLNGTFQYCPFPAWLADSTRSDSPTKIIENNGNMFITGFTIDYNKVCQGQPWDPQTFLMKVNSAGTMQWCKTYYIKATPTQEYGVDLAAVTSDATNDIIVLSRSDNSGNVELCRVQNATGNIVWAKSFDCGYSERGWGLKETPDGKFVISVTANAGPIGSYDMILLKIDRDGLVLNSKGVGTSNMDGTDSWAWYGPNVDAFSQGTYAIAGVSNFSGGATGSSFIAKIPNQSFSTGCPPHEFNVTVTVINRNSGGANQLQTRTPVVYQTRGGAGKGNLTLTATPFVPIATNPCLLPVELLNFSAEWKEENSVKTSWTTASEKNNDYFTVERSFDAKEFSPIATVAGSGSTSVIHNYEFVDDQPPSPLGEGPGVRYYRLKQTDFDSKFEYSPIVSVHYTGIRSFSVYSDNTTKAIDFSFTLNSKQTTFVRIFDAVGKEVMYKRIYGDKGVNIVSVPAPDLSNGIYFASFTSEFKTINKNFIIAF